MELMMRVITALAAVGAILSGCALDSPSTLPMKVCALCLAWLMWVAVQQVRTYGW